MPCRPHCVMPYSVCSLYAGCRVLHAGCLQNAIAYRTFGCIHLQGATVIYPPIVRSATRLLSSGAEIIWGLSQLNLRAEGLSWHSTTGGGSCHNSGRPDESIESINGVMVNRLTTAVNLSCLILPNDQLIYINIYK